MDFKSSERLHFHPQAANIGGRTPFLNISASRHRQREVGCKGAVFSVSGFRAAIGVAWRRPHECPLTPVAH
jgi:hypothetical protein